MAPGHRVARLEKAKIAIVRRTLDPLHTVEINPGVKRPAA
jgi:hypothetical protein